MASRRTHIGIVSVFVIVGVLMVGGGAWAFGAFLPSSTAGASASSTMTARPTPTASPTPLPVVTPSATPTTMPTSAPASAFDKTAHSIDDPASVWVVVNKARPLNPNDYVPADLVRPPVPNINDQPVRAETADALVALFDAARNEAGLSLTLQSGYRSYATQVAVYNDDVAANGQAYADSDTARPGHSEHQTGLAVDISAASGRCSLAACFGETPEGQWLAANAWRFGFLLRYPADKVAVTGFTYEPWHFRYIGGPLATQLHSVGITTLEEYFGVPGGETYPQ